MKTMLHPYWQTEKNRKSEAEGKQTVKITGRQKYYGVYMLTYRKLKQTYIQTDKQTQSQIYWNKI